jgi:hypothetical protein
VRGKWLQRVRLIHTWLGVFFSPLLLMFVITGWWQTFMPDDDDQRGKGFLNSILLRFSTIHTDNYFPHPGGGHHASELFKFLVAGMALSLILTILLGLALACQSGKRFGWIAAAFVLGILIPALALYFN